MVGHALGHEGHGSLAAALKARGLISSLRVGVEEEVRAGQGRFIWVYSSTISRPAQYRPEFTPWKCDVLTAAPAMCLFVPGAGSAWVQPDGGLWL